MNKQGIAPDIQDKIVQSIASFALYGFPESHAASFALIAYASAYLKCHYLAAFTAAILNNQPMGFYSAATLVKDAQRHGLKIKPIDVDLLGLVCTLGTDLPLIRNRIRLSYSESPHRKNLTTDKCATSPCGSASISSMAFAPKSPLKSSPARHPPFRFHRRLEAPHPRLQKSELTALAEIGAL